MLTKEEIQDIALYSKNIKLLYIEDNEIVRDSTLKIFETFFNTITIAIDGLDGLEKFKNSDIDLIITDINMPNLDGLEMVSKIRELDKKIQILMLSAHNEPDFFTASIKLNVEGYLLKPIEISQFLSVLNKVVKNIKIKEEFEENLCFLQQCQEVADKGSIVSKTDLNGNIIYVNDEFCKISKYSREELIGKNHSIIRNIETKDEFYKELWETIGTKQEIWHGNIKNRAKNGESYYLKSTIKPILSKSGELLEYISSSSDITDIMNPQKQLDSLIESAEETILVLIEIEDFAQARRFYGKQIATEMERQFQDFIDKAQPKKCQFEKVFVLGDGRFALGMNKKKCTIGIEAMILEINSLQKSLDSAVLELDEISYEVTTLVSLSFGSNSLENSIFGLKELIKTKQNFIISNDFAEVEYKKAKENMRVIKMVKEAIENKKIISLFQPIIDNKTGKVNKYESLVRMQDRDGNLISPFFFLDIAKEGKYYSQITALVLENTFHALVKCTEDVSINLSVIDIEKVSTRDKIMELLEEYKRDAHRIVFELLEDENSKDFEVVLQFIDDVQKYGVKIAIDDFGSGYSNFERLLNYKPDILKLDGSLIKNIATDDFSLNVVETIVAFAKKQGILTVAEYVENKEIFEILQDLGVDYSQGYYFGKPEKLK